MDWNRDRVRALRCRMGWSHSDLARRLSCEAEVIAEWERGKRVPVNFQLERLNLLEKQADVKCDETFCLTLADIIFEESDSEQLDTSDVKNRFS